MKRQKNKVSKAPSIDQIWYHPVHIDGQIIIGDRIIRVFVSKRSWGSWFGKWWTIALQVNVHSYAHPSIQKRALANEIVVGSIVEAFNEVKVVAWRAKRLCPSFRYKLPKPIDVYVKGAIFMMPDSRA